MGIQREFSLGSMLGNSWSAMRVLNPVLRMYYVGRESISEVGTWGVVRIGNIMIVKCTVRLVRLELKTR